MVEIKLMQAPIISHIEHGYDLSDKNQSILAMQ